MGESTDVTVTVAVTPNTPDELRRVLVETMAAPGRTVNLARFEQRSLEYGDVITLMIVWVVSVATDELVREAVRSSVAAFRKARTQATTQGMFELPTSPPIEYWCGDNVPDEALDAIEADATTATPGASRYWLDGRWQTP
jgi:hypothetical protein